MRWGRRTSTAERVLRTITSPSNSRRRSGLRGDFGLPGRINSLRNSVSVASNPGFSTVIRLYSSRRLFSTGVAVSIRMNFFWREFTSFQFELVRFFRQCASSTITMSQGTSERADACGSMRAMAMEATTRGSLCQRRAGSERNPGSSGEAGAMPNFSTNSPFHCETSEGGVSTRTLRTMPRIQYSFRTRHASMVLPSPVSSASRARPL